MITILETVEWFLFDFFALCLELADVVAELFDYLIDFMRCSISRLF